MKTIEWLTAILMISMCSPLYGSVAPPYTVGCGEPGLKIVFKTTNQFVIFVDEPWTIGSGLIGGYSNRQIDVLCDRNYGLKEKLRSRTWDDNPEQLYSLDDGTAFTADGARWDPVRKARNWPGKTKVFSIKGDSITVSDDVYALACARYNLTTNQLFLGKIGTNIYYWETQDLRRVYYRPVSRESATNYFELPKGILDYMGVTCGVKGKDNIEFAVLRKSKGFSYSPNEFTFIEVAFKDAKQVALVKP